MLLVPISWSSNTCDIVGAAIVVVLNTRPKLSATAAGGGGSNNFGPLDPPFVLVSFCTAIVFPRIATVLSAQRGGKSRARPSYFGAGDLPQSCALTVLSIGGRAV